MKSVKVLQISDLHILATPGARMLGVDTEYYFQRTLVHAFSQHCGFDLVIVTGDLAQDSIASVYRRIGSNLAHYRTKCLCLPGNHDDFGLMKTYLHNEWVSCEKHYQSGTWHVLLLNSQIENSPAGHIEDSELAWLESTLKNHINDFFLIALHHHAYSSSCAWLDKIGLKHGEMFCKRLSQYPNVKVVINGHIHQDVATRVGDIAWFGSPSTCFQFKPKSEHFRIDESSPGYRILNLIDDGSVTTQCYRIPERLMGLEIDTPGY